MMSTKDVCTKGGGQRVSQTQTKVGKWEGGFDAMQKTSFTVGLQTFDLTFWDDTHLISQY